MSQRPLLPFVIIFVVFLCCALAVLSTSACRSPEADDSKNTREESSESPEEPGTAAPDTDVGETPEATIVGSGRGIEVTVEDYALALQAAALQGHPYKKETLAEAGFQRAHLMRVLQRAALRQEAKDRGITVTRAELRALAAEDATLAPWAELDDEAFEAVVAAERGVLATELWRILEDRALLKAYTEELLDEIDDDSLWERYRQQKTKIALHIVRLLNVPTSHEITEVVRTRRTDLEAYYKAHRDRYVVPARATVRRIVIPVAISAPDDEVRAARERAEELRRRTANEDFALLAKEHSGDPKSKEKGGLMPPVGRKQLPLAFDVPIGSVSEVFRGPQGFMIIKVEGRTEKRIRPFEPAIEREIASLVIQEAGAAPSVDAVARGAIEALKADDQPALDKVLEGQRVDVFHTEPLPMGGQKRLPGLGYLPKVHAAAFALTTEAPVSPEPIVDGEYVYAVRLESREEPDCVLFETNIDAFRAVVRDNERRRIAQAGLSARLGADVIVNLRPIQQRYGLKQQDGSIAEVP